MSIKTKSDIRPKIQLVQFEGAGEFTKKMKSSGKSDPFREYDLIELVSKLLLTVR